MDDSENAVVESIRPIPSDEEAAAIAAAVMIGLSTGAEPGGDKPRVSRWRFSGRWWSRPVPTRRARPGL